MRLKEYHLPKSEDEALNLLRRNSPRTVIMGGGTWLTAEGSKEIEAVADIRELGFNHITRQSSPPMYRIGAAMTLESLVNEFKSVPGLTVLSEGSYAMAALNNRNQSTIGGAIVTADACSPIVTALLACDAEIVIKTTEKRTIALSAFLDYRERIISEKILITGIQMPVPSTDTVSVYTRVARTPRDYPIVCVAARCAVKDGIIGNMRVAIGGVASTPIRLRLLEFALEKKAGKQVLDSALHDAVSELSPASNWLGSSEYRSAMATILVRRAIIQATKIQ